MSGNPLVVLSQIKLDNPALFNIRIYSQEDSNTGFKCRHAENSAHGLRIYNYHCCLCPPFHHNLDTCPVSPYI